MAIELKGTETFIIATNGKDIFHPVYVAKNLVCTTGQKYIIESKVGATIENKEDGVYNRIFVSPQRDEELGEYIIKDLVAKPEADIVKEIDYTNPVKMLIV